MKCVMENDNFIVYDDVLAKEQFKELYDFASDLPYIPSHMNGWAKVWSLNEGAPFVTRTFYSDVAEAHNPLFETEDPNTIYPTGDVIDDLFHTVLCIQEKIMPVVGKKGDDWYRFSAATFVYPPGAGLSWHTDQFDYNGAFVFYLSQEWKPSWGGELLLQSPITENADDETHNLINQKEYDLGYFVAPKPNRLIILKSGTPHKINRVSPSAGENFRFAFSGFFIKPTLDRQLQKKISNVTIIKRWDTKYIARYHNEEASLVARNNGCATGNEKYIPIFEYIADKEKIINAENLPGDFSIQEKIGILKNLIEADVLQGPK